MQNIFTIWIIKLSFKKKTEGKCQSEINLWSPSMSFDAARIFENY